MRVTVRPAGDVPDSVTLQELTTPTGAAVEGVTVPSPLTYDGSSAWVWEDADVPMPSPPGYIVRYTTQRGEVEGGPFVEIVFLSSPLSGDPVSALSVEGFSFVANDA